MHLYGTGQVDVIVKMEMNPSVINSYYGELASSVRKVKFYRIN